MVDIMEKSKNTNAEGQNNKPPIACGVLEACTGCGACAAACPYDSIALYPDDAGFFYPVTDTNTCTGCGVCQQVCPVDTRESLSGGNSPGIWGAEPLAVFASWHLDEEIRRTSSSGGVFTALAENILAKGGVVVGAAFDSQFVVRHILIETSKELYRIRGSKYVQSQLPQSLYQRIKAHLKRGLPVLFSGTPCQVAGIKNFLGKDYTNFFCCDLACMGVPSPNLFKKYFEWKQSKIGAPLVSCEFRNKTYGWKAPSIRLCFSGENNILERGRQNPYYLAFGSKIALRPSCYACTFKGGRRESDLTLADFWSVAKNYPDYDREDKGTSLVLINTDKGKSWLQECQNDLFLGVADLDTAVAGNPMLVHSCQRPLQRETFYKDLNHLTFEEVVRKYRLQGPTKFQLLAGKAKSAVRHIIHELFLRNASGAGQ